MKTISIEKKPVIKDVTPKLNVLLADDDPADCLLFKDALEELPLSTHLATVNNGEQLIEAITKKLPDVLFLDLNMPRKNGFAALGQIKRNDKFDKLPVIIFSTASDINSVKQVYKDAAHYYIIKPDDFSQLKKVIYEALTLIMQKDKSYPLENDFMITGNATIIPEVK